ncbi:MAG: lysophospholipid acyltransferase family protein [Granulosicoccaceae bacterium]
MIKILAAMPLRLNHAVGALIGNIAWYLNTRERTIAMVNINLCFSDKTETEKKQLAHSSLKETGKALTEAAWIWTRPPEQLEALIVDTIGGEVLQRAKHVDKGLLVATPHMGTWELCNLPLSREQSITYLYKTPRFSKLEQQLISWRANLNALPANVGPSGIRQLLKKLKSGGTVGLLPDQEPDIEAGVFAPFFKVPANTMTLLPKLAERGKANIVFCFAERLPKGRGWHMHYLEPDKKIYSDDQLLAATALNRTVERCVQHCPEQYVWNYKRFQLLPDGSNRDYMVNKR